MLNREDKILITGANGFIGTAVVDFARYNALEYVTLPRELLYFPKDLREFLQKENPKYIIHLAAYGNHYDQQDESQIVNTNIIGTFNLLQASKDIAYKGFINISSSSVYGTKEIPMREDMPLDTDTFYGASKVAGEYLVKAFVKKYKKPVINVRPFSVYGENEAPHRFIPTIIRCIENHTPINLDPNPFHDWIYIKDFVEALFTLLEYPGKFTGQAINIGTGEQYSNKDVLEKIEWILNSKTEVNISDKQREYDTSVWVADINYLKSLGITPKTDLMKGLRNVCKALSKYR
jgi:nucleoside-diphosphate-sugar epimerase